MSEIFEALRKAQKQADARRVTGAGAPSGTNGGIPAGQADPEPNTGVERRTIRKSHRRRFGWLPRLWGAGGNGRAAGEYAVLISPEHETSIGEQFRVLRTRLEMAGRGSVMITSALDQEGKTLCASNLAIALSMNIGSGVILVDADLRHPSVARVFGLRGSPGLTDYLLGDVGWEECLQPTQYRGLSVLPAGHNSSMANELLGSERMAALIVEIKERFPNNITLLDAPPLLLTADPLVIARYVDHVVLVVRAGITPRAAIAKAVETLGADRFLGAIFNDATKHVSHYYYYNGRYPYGDQDGRPEPA